MKKITAFILSVVSAALVFAGCTGSGDAFTEKSFSADGSQVKDISIDVHDRKIEVFLSEDSKIHIDYYESDKEFYDIYFTDNDVLTMNSKSGKEWSDYVGGKPGAENRVISLRLPGRFCLR